jgi:two-component system CheB/CheR fusion protein
MTAVAHERADAKASTVAPLPPLHVLVVEDCADARESLALLLGLFGCRVDGAAGCAEAMARAGAAPPDVLLMDIGLPACDGYAVAKRLRGLCERAPLVVATTGYGRECDRRRSAEEGFDHHLVKPVDPAELVGILRRHARSLGRAVEAERLGRSLAGRAP